MCKIEHILYNFELHLPELILHNKLTFQYQYGGKTFIQAHISCPFPPNTCETLAETVLGILRCELTDSQDIMDSSRFSFQFF
jgi:hypothetical protein